MMYATILRRIGHYHDGQQEQHQDGGFAVLARRVVRGGQQLPDAVGNDWGRRAATALVTPEAGYWLRLLQVMWSEKEEVTALTRDTDDSAIPHLDLVTCHLVIHLSSRKGETPAAPW